VSFRSLSAARFRSETEYGAHYDWMSPFVGNHDIPRTAQLIFNNGGGIDPWAGVPDPMNNGWNDATWNIVNRLSMAFAFVLTQPGIPLIYYGDEVGLYGGPDPDNRRFMPSLDSLTDPQSELLTRVQRIGRARRDYEALRRGRFVELWVDDDFFVYARQTTDGQVAIVETTGNPDCHLILRGGKAPNYDATHVEAAGKDLEAAKLPGTLMVDCSHANSSKQHDKQIDVARNIAAQLAGGSRRIFGVMVESHLNPGAQKFSPGKDDPAKLAYGQSITDACIGWEDTLTVLDALGSAIKARRR
jgi:hypothetical protein